MLHIAMIYWMMLMHCICGLTCGDTPLDIICCSHRMQLHYLSILPLLNTPDMGTSVFLVQGWFPCLRSMSVLTGLGKKECVRPFTNWIQFRFLCLIMSLILNSKSLNDLLVFSCDVSWLINLFHKIQDRNTRNNDSILMISIVYIDDFPRRKLSNLIQLSYNCDDHSCYKQSKLVWGLLSL